MSLSGRVHIRNVNDATAFPRGVVGEQGGKHRRVSGWDDPVGFEKFSSGFHGRVQTHLLPVVFDQTIVETLCGGGSQGQEYTWKKEKVSKYLNKHKYKRTTLIIFVAPCKDQNTFQLVLENLRFFPCFWFLQLKEIFRLVIHHSMPRNVAVPAVLSECVFVRNPLLVHFA